MPGFFQTALYDSNYFTDSIRDDVILRASSNNSLRLGVGSNTGILITPNNDVIIKGNITIDKFAISNLEATIMTPIQPFIQQLGPLYDLEVIGHSFLGSNNDGYIFQIFMKAVIQLYS